MLLQRFKAAWYGWLNGTTIIERHQSCPCLHTTPCQPRCTCVHGGSSSGCYRCCSYGSKEQQKHAAERLAKKIDIE